MTPLPSMIVTVLSFESRISLQQDVSRELSKKKTGKQRTSSQDRRPDPESSSQRRTGMSRRLPTPVWILVMSCSFKLYCL